jgi:hypothetical protein
MTAEIKKTPTQFSKDRWAMQNHAAKLLVGHRVSFCLRSPISKKESIKVVERSPLEEGGNKRFGFTGLQCCGSVHGCPMCASKIALQREKEIRIACLKAHSEGLWVCMLTLTHPHQKYDLLQGQLDSLLGYKEEDGKRVNGALQHFKNSKTWRRLVLVGHISKFEATYGANGWHPHYHLILFIDPKKLIKSRSMRCFSEMLLHEEWERSCVRVGFDLPKWGVGLQLVKADNPVDIAGYVSKMGSWDFAKEMTKDQAKQSKKDGSTPWQLLRKSMVGCEKSGRLFVEYVDCTKGVRSLVWSRGLKDRFGINKVSDKEAFEDLKAVKAIVFEFGRRSLGVSYKDGEKKEIVVSGAELWALVLNYGSRYVVLRCAEKGKECVWLYLKTLIKKHGLRENMPFMDSIDIRATS